MKNMLVGVGGDGGCHDRRVFMVDGREKHKAMGATRSQVQGEGQRCQPRHTPLHRLLAVSSSYGPQYGDCKHFSHCCCGAYKSNGDAKSSGLLYSAINIVDS